MSLLKVKKKEITSAPFYNEKTKKMFVKFWNVPRKKPSIKRINFMKGFVNNNETESYLYKEKNDINDTTKTCHKLLKNIYPDTIGTGDITIRSRKIRFFPTIEQKHYFNKCFGTTRFIYNKMIYAFKMKSTKQREKFKKMAKKGCIKNIPGKIKGTHKQCCSVKENKFFCHKHIKCKVPYTIDTNFINWRNKIIKSEADLPENEKWLADIPYDTRQLVIKNALGGIKSALTNLKNGNITHFDMRFKSKKNHSQYFFIDHRVLKKGMFLWKKKLKDPLVFKNKEKIWIENLMNGEDKMKDMIINRERTGKYFIQIPYNQQPIYGTSNNIVSVDPGVITFHSFYSPSGICGKIGDGFSKSLEKHNEEADLIQAKISIVLNAKTNLKQKSKKNPEKMKKLRKKIKHLKKHFIKVKNHISNCVKDLQQKAIKYYCDNYKHIIVPDFDSIAIAKKLKRLGLKKQARKTVELSHRSFITRLRTKIETYPGRKFYLVGEHYTSQACGSCGILNKGLGSNRHFTCINCDYEADRDLNASRNILISTLNCTENTF